MAERVTWFVAPALEHDMDGLTFTCRRCGVTMEQLASAGPSPCHDGPNIVSLSTARTRNSRRRAWFVGDPLQPDP